jgi:hypothetical protein
MPSHGTLTLYIDDKAVGSAEIKTQLGNFSLVGEGLNVGKDVGEPVTDDYPPVGVRRRHNQAGDRRRLRRALRRPGEGSRRDDEPGMTRSSGMGSLAIAGPVRGEDGSSAMHVGG